jgi:UDP-N-acetylmuramoylalanine--D-glutamate ligase
MGASLKNKRVLVLGLGVLGGGVATTNWLLDRGARVTVTDLKNEEQLASSVKRIEEHLKRSAPDGKSYEKSRARLVWALGGHSRALIDAADIVVVNPDVSVNNPFVQRALARGIAVANEGTLFYDHWNKPSVGVTGTRGKTTTATWTNHLLGSSVLTGNSVVKPFLSALAESGRHRAAVTELSSFILELFDRARRGPRVAVITNLYRDHLNRHGSMEEYARAKANVFVHQRASDALILNADDEWTPWFLSRRPASRVYRTSMRPLPAGVRGVWYQDHAIWEHGANRDRKVVELSGFIESWGAHNVANVLQAVLAARIMGASYASIQRRIASLPAVPYRQEVVYRDAHLTVVNDTTATSPEAGIAALKRWGGPTCVLITGGTDRELEYRAWAKELPKHIRRTNTVFLSGSATQKMRAALRKDAAGIRAFDSLEKAWEAALERARTYVTATILFSPAAKSFELFQNEYDRGQQFNTIVKHASLP